MEPVSRHNMSASGYNWPSVDEEEEESLKERRAAEHRCGAAAAAVSAGVIGLKLYPSCSPCPHPTSRGYSSLRRAPLHFEPDEKKRKGKKRMPQSFALLPSLSEL